jgi:hypothetical protein
MSEPPTSITGIVAMRGITEVLHFTTNFGLIGVGAKQAVLSRDLLDSDQYLEHIATPVWANRWKDADWTGYVNLSISHVSYRMFSTSRRNRAGEDLWWPVLSFSPEILNDPGVVFTTTNNSYEKTVKRGEGHVRLDAMFGPRIEWGHYGTVDIRRSGMPDSWTTNDQAEVLYPGRLGLEHLQAIYVESEERIDDATGLLGLWPSLSAVPVIHKPEAFK